MEWFLQHPILSLYLLASLLWALWNITRSAVRKRWLRPGPALLQILFAPILMPLTLLGSRREPPWMGLRWKCPNCAWAMFTEECEECGAVGLPYDPVTQRVVEDDQE